MGYLDNVFTTKLDLKPIDPLDSNQLKLTPQVNGIDLPQKIDFKFNAKQKNPSVGNQLAAAGTQAAASKISDWTSDKIFDDSRIGSALGGIFSSGLSSAGNTISNNIAKGQLFSEGLGQNAAASVSGTAVGLASNYIGEGINRLGGDSMLSRGIGQGVATGLGIYGGNAVAGLFGKAGAINPYGAAMQIVGSGLQAALGPSKEYGGKYGNITQTMDGIYDLATGVVGMIPGGQLISAGMVLNKGLLVSGERLEV